MTTATATRPPGGPSAGERGSVRPLAGAGTLVRFILRRDRVRLPVWIGAITLFTIGSVASLRDLYLTDADRQARAELMTNPGTRAISGPGYGLDDYTFGAMIAHEYLSWVGIFVALMSILLMVRHTRSEEETGRAELVRAGVVGRHAQTTAALIVVGGGSLVMGLLLGLGLGSLGLESVDWAGSFLFGLALASIGIVFAAVTAVTVQVSQVARGAGGLAGVGLALAYLLRAAGDMSATEGGGVLSWLSPIGWAQQTRVYVDDRWWPLLLSVALAALLVATGYWLSTRRDVGAGLVPPRPGSPTGSAALASPLGLAWRLHRVSVMWWTIALLGFGLGYGTLASEVESFAEDFSAMQDFIDVIGGDSIIDAFLAMITSLIAVAVSIFAVLTVLRLRSEESSGRAEPLLATATSRIRLAASHLIVAAVGSAVILALGGLGLGLTASAALDDARFVPDLLGAALAYLPAVWLTIGLGVALFGVVPRASVLVWIVIAYAGLIGSFAAILDLPEWTLNLSPFGHIPALPAVDLNWTPLVILTAISAGLVALGFYGFRRRDLETK
jgi:ABC-2 type transport system permease protein